MIVEETETVLKFYVQGLMGNIGIGFISVGIIIVGLQLITGSQGFGVFPASQNISTFRAGALIGVAQAGWTQVSQF